MRPVTSSMLGRLFRVASAFETESVDELPPIEFPPSEPFFHLLTRLFRTLRFFSVPPPAAGIDCCGMEGEFPDGVAERELAADD